MTNDDFARVGDNVYDFLNSSYRHILSGHRLAASQFQPQGAILVLPPAEPPSDVVSRYPQVVGIILAICSGLLIGSSFVFKKKGLLRSQAGHEAGEGVSYLKSVSGARLCDPIKSSDASASHYGGPG